MESALTPSPCVRNCCLDDDDVCLGCGRALAEIIAWSTAPEDDRREILRRSRERLEGPGRQSPPVSRRNE